MAPKPGRKSDNFAITTDGQGKLELPSMLDDSRSETTVCILIRACVSVYNFSALYVASSSATQAAQIIKIVPYTQEFCFVFLSTRQFLIVRQSIDVNCDRYFLS